MKTVAFLVTILTLSLFAQEISPAKIVKLSNKGEKIVKTLCESDKLPNAEGTIEQLIEKVKNSHACPSLPKSKLEAVAYYVSNGSMKLTGKHITVPIKAKCPVCGMFVGKYPKWVGLIVVDGKKYHFDGAKDLMKFYIFDADFPYDRSKITAMAVTDFYTLEGIPAKEAFYVIGSDLYGPMGNELIPFKTRKAAKNFLNDHGGSKVVLFDKITAKMVMALDGVEYEE
jgi:nitrous oxide reductase accessory protein NosL